MSRIIPFHTQPEPPIVVIDPYLVAARWIARIVWSVIFSIVFTAVFIVCVGVAVGII